MRRFGVLGIVAATALWLAMQAAPALSHGGNEMAIQDLKQQPARTLAQQALAELRVRGDVEEAGTRLDAALESKDTADVDMGVLRRAMETLDSGEAHAAIPLLDEALSRPLGSSSGKALHESGREFQPATGAEEIVGIIAGAVLLLLGGALLLRPHPRAPA
jgi:hypothetical protein